MMGAPVEMRDEDPTEAATHSSLPAEMLSLEVCLWAAKTALVLAVDMFMCELLLV